MMNTTLHQLTDDIENTINTIKSKFLAPITFFGGNLKEQELYEGITSVNKNNVEYELTPDNTKEYSILVDGITYHMRSVYNTYYIGSLFNINNNVFMRITMNGKLSLLKYQYTKASPGAPMPGGGFSGGYVQTITKEFLLKKDGSLLKLGRWKFKKKMKEYFSDCPELTDRIETKIFRFKNTEEIINFYNSSCK